MNISNLFNHKGKQGKRRTSASSSAHVPWRERLGEDAYVGWAVILTLSLVTFVCLTGWAARLFILICSGGITAPAVSASASHQTFNPAALESLISDFNQRSTMSAALDRGYGGPTDPSR